VFVAYQLVGLDLAVLQEQGLEVVLFQRRRQVVHDQVGLAHSDTLTRALSREATATTTRRITAVGEDWGGDNGREEEEQEVSLVGMWQRNAQRGRREGEQRAAREARRGRKREATRRRRCFCSVCVGPWSEPVVGICDASHGANTRHRTVKMCVDFCLVRLGAGWSAAAGEAEVVGGWSGTRRGGVGEGFGGQEPGRRRKQEQQEAGPWYL